MSKLHLSLAVLFTLSSGVGAASEPGHPAGPSPTDVVRRLLEGNERFVAGKLAACGKTTPELRQRLATGQAPRAIVISCSDSRLPPELVFDEEPGELFVVRVAGNTVDPIVLGSVEYAAEHLGSPLIVVLGHERCGAVTAAVDAGGNAVEGNIGALVAALAPAVEKARKTGVTTDKKELVERSMLANVALVAQSLTTRSPVLAHLVAERRLVIVGARYDLDDGKVRLVDTGTTVATH